jgi:Ran GTPase-activating protein (RanGAP) involved in mRNA processing and transport
MRKPVTRRFAVLRGTVEVAIKSYWLDAFLQEVSEALSPRPGGNHPDKTWLRCYETLKGNGVGERIDMSDMGFSTVDMARLTAALRSTKCKVRALKLWNNSLHADDVNTLIGTIGHKHRSIRGVGLTGNPIGDDGVQHIAHALDAESCNFEALALQNIGATCAGTAVLFKAMSNNSSCVRRLYLSDNNLGDTGIAAVASYLRSCPTNAMEELTLSNIRITPDGAAEIFESLGNNCSLKMLSLKHNSIGRVGIDKASGMFSTNNTLNKLDLRDTQLCTADVENLISAVIVHSNFALQEISIAENDIDKSVQRNASAVFSSEACQSRQQKRTKGIITYANGKMELDVRSVVEVGTDRLYFTGDSRWDSQPAHVFQFAVAMWGDDQAKDQISILRSSGIMQNSNLVQYLGSHKESGQYFFAMESFSSSIQHQQANGVFYTEVCRQVLNAVDCLLKHGVNIRMLSSETIFFSGPVSRDGIVKVKLQHFGPWTFDPDYDVLSEPRCVKALGDVFSECLKCNSAKIKDTEVRHDNNIALGHLVEQMKASSELSIKRCQNHHVFWQDETTIQLICELRETHNNLANLRRALNQKMAPYAGDWDEKIPQGKHAPWQSGNLRESAKYNAEEPGFSLIIFIRNCYSHVGQQVLRGVFRNTSECAPFFLDNFPWLPTVLSEYLSDTSKQTKTAVAVKGTTNPVAFKDAFSQYIW